MNTYRKPNQQLFSQKVVIRLPKLNYKYESIHKALTGQKLTQKFKHQDIKRKDPPQNYRLGTISNIKLLAGLNRFYMAITSPSTSAVVQYPKAIVGF